MYPQPDLHQSGDFLVNDGSTDSSPQLCEQLARLDSRIRVVHQENRGVGSARNAGLDIATGKYVTFYDVDDEIEPGLIEKNVQQAEEFKTEVIVFGMVVHQRNNSEAEKMDFPDQLITSNKTLKENFVEKLLLKKWGNGFVWNKFYLRSFLETHHIRFEDQLIMQDEIFNLKVYYKVERLLLSSECPYHYYIHDDGNFSRYLPNKFEIFLDVIDSFYRLFDYWKLEDPLIDVHLRNRYIDYVIHVSSANLFHIDSEWSNGEKIKFLRTLIVEPKTARFIQPTKLAAIPGIWGKVQIFCIKNNFPVVLLILNSVKYAIKHKLR